jgi:hypothetical protein
MRKLKKEKYLGKTIIFTEMEGGEKYGLRQDKNIHAFIRSLTRTETEGRPFNTLVGTGNTKSEALKEAKQQIRNIIKQEKVNRR